MSTPLSLASPTVAPTPACDESFGLPEWLYRSEAFAEDLAGALAAAPVAHELPAPRRLQRHASAALYLATLGLALVCSVPSALLVA